ncbi:MAG: hypothetical protein ACFFDB_10975 [Promethearchaeota archaeon]
MEENEERILTGIALILVGVMVIINFLPPFIYMLGEPFSLGTLRLIEFWLLGIVFTLTGIFTIVKLRTNKGKIVLGVISSIMGGIFVVGTLITIILLLRSFWGTQYGSLFWIEVPVWATFLTAGTVLIVHGQFLIIKQQKNIKVVRDIIFFSIGITIIIWVPRIFYLLLISTTSIPFFGWAIYIDVFIVGIVTLIICYFIVKPIKKEKTKLLMGIISIIIGGVIIVLSILGIVSFSIYLGGMDGGGIA